MPLIVLFYVIGSPALILFALVVGAAALLGGGKKSP